MTERVDAVVVGAGAVGLAVGRALARAGAEVIVAEAQPAIGQGVSSRNSEVIHAGIYYTPGSLKARLCVQGRELLYEFCETHGVPHQRCGKFIVATREAELAALEVIRQRASSNGVELHWLDGDAAMRIEPALRCVAALVSPATGIIDSHGYMLALQGGLERHGGVVALGSAVESARLATADGHVLRFADGSELACRWLVNSASLHAPALARRFEGLDPAHVPQAFFSKGNYYSLAGRAPFSRLVYPAPSDAWLGVHLTLDLGGQARFGPDQEWLDVDRPEAIDYRVDPRRADGFYEEVRRYWPGLPDGALQPAYSGVRPKIHGPADKAPDFRIDGPALHGVEGLVNLFGIESPGLTSSLAIADEVLRLLANPS